MDSKNFAKFLKNLDVKSVETRKYYGDRVPQDLLSLTLEKPFVFNVRTSDCLFSCVSDCIEIFSRAKVIDFLVGGYLDRTTCIDDIESISVKEASLERYEENRKRLEEDSFSY